MAYEMVMPYHLHMPSYFLETFTEYPYINKGHIMLQVQDIYLAPATLHKQKHLLIFNRPASHCQPKAYFRESR